MRALGRGLLAVCLIAVPAAAPAVELAFVLVEGNVGGASGGHTAVRVGGEDGLVFHYQHDGSLFRLTREGWPRFQLQYGGFQNRPLHLATVELSDDVAMALRERLTARHLGALRDRGLGRASTRERQLADALVGRRRGVPLLAAGYLGEQPDADGLALRAALEARLAPRRLADLRQQSAERLEAALRHVARDGADRQELAAVYAAFEWDQTLGALDAGSGLAPGALLDPVAEGLDAAALGQAELEALGILVDRLTDRMAALIASGVPSQGPAVAVAAARHHVLRRALRTRRLVVLDVLPGSGKEPGSQRGRLPARERAGLDASVGRAGLALAALRTRVLAQSPVEADWSQLEDGTARAVELARSAQRGRPAELPAVRLVPRRRRDVALPAAADPALAVLREAARAHERSTWELLATRYAYDLSTRNCVTELVADVEAGMGGPAVVVDQLGGRLRSDGSLGFWPIAYHRELLQRLDRLGAERVPSYREVALARLRADGGGLGTSLSEATAFTSGVYTRRDADGSFVVFTSGRETATRLARPLLGAANLVYGLGDGLLGVFTLPFDRGQRLRRAGRGLLFSLPELAFLNVRKGSFDARSLPDGAYP